MNTVLSVYRLTSVRSGPDGMQHETLRMEWQDATHMCTRPRQPFLTGISQRKAGMFSHEGVPLTAHQGDVQNLFVVSWFGVQIN